MRLCTSETSEVILQTRLISQVFPVRSLTAKREQPITRYDRAEQNIVLEQSAAADRAIQGPDAQYNLNVESNQNVESKRQSVESKMGKRGVKLPKI